MHLDCGPADEQALGDFWIAHPFHQQGQHLLLAPGQVCCQALSLEGGLDQSLDGFGRQGRPPAVRQEDGLA